MNSPSQPKPRFIGGSTKDHLLFVVALCRFQHHSLKLASLHYLTWSAMHVGLYAIAMLLFGPAGAMVLGGILVGWALRLDARAGLVFGLLEVACAYGAYALVQSGVLPAGHTAAAVAVAFGAMVASLMAEVAGHLVFQGYPPHPPARVVADLPRRQILAFVPYFVVVFGMFFLTLDLAMRLFGHRSGLHAQANALSAQWHADAAGVTAPQSREAWWHRRAVAEQS